MYNVENCSLEEYALGGGASLYDERSEGKLGWSRIDPYLQFLVVWVTTGKTKLILEYKGLKLLGHWRLDLFLECQVNNVPPTTNGHSHEPVGSPIRDLIYQPQRKLKFVVVGAGASDLLLIYKVQRHFADLEIEVFEKHRAVSGVWLESVGGSFSFKQCMRRRSLLMTCRRARDALVTFLFIVSEYFRIG